MNKKEEAFHKRLLVTFKVEADEHLKSMASELLELERTPTSEKQTDIIETIFRRVHSLKGAARAVNMTDIGSICQSIESVFSELKRKVISLSPGMFDTLHHVIDTIGKLLTFPEQGKTNGISEVIQQLARFEASEDVAEIQTKEVSKTEEQAPFKSILEVEESTRSNYQILKENIELTKTIRISTAKLDSLLLQAEEMVSTKLAVDQHIVDLRDIRTTLGLWKKDWVKLFFELKQFQNMGIVSAKSSSSFTGKGSVNFNNPKFLNILEVLDDNNAYFKSLESKLTTLTKMVEDDNRLHGEIVDNLLDNMKKVLMFPSSLLLEIFPKMVRNLSREQGKEVELVVTGNGVEVDKRILEEMKDPLIHLVRNCIDHGIENPEERTHKKKPTCGTITIAISQVDSNNVEIIVSDDGAGIDQKDVKETVVKRGIMSEKEVNKLSPQEILSLIFQSEVSTKKIITDISGRGLGLAIAREKVEKLGGLISVESMTLIGTSIRILIPVTLATLRGILIQAADQVFIIPTVNVERVLRINQDDVKTVENKETISVNGQVVSLVYLNDILGLQRKEKKGKGTEFIQVLVLGSTEKRIAFRVDEVISEKEILVKSLGKQLSQVQNITGATVLGSGKAIPILNIPDVIKSAVKATVLFDRPVVPSEEAETKRKSILVVEDSITSRTLLKNILETAGYHVKTTVDGVDGLTALKREDFDLVVSDVDMPRMNGFNLVSKIRIDKKLSELPVVLVTALESREDRERGIDVGADAYIVKSSFDQSNLLEVVGKLL